jgi:hypothetical protein
LGRAVKREGVWSDQRPQPKGMNERRPSTKSFRRSGSVDDRGQRKWLTGRTALDLADRCEPGRFGHSAAWSHAEKAIDLISRQIEVTTPLVLQIANASWRVRSATTLMLPNERDRH